MTNRSRNSDPALRPQPRRDGNDFWGTPYCLTGALISDVIPKLPPGLIWEPAAGDGKFAEAIRRAGHEVLATDIDTCDFLTDVPPTVVSAIVTNPPFNRIDPFINRALALLDDGLTDAVVLLMRLDHLAAKRRTSALARAVEIRLCPWRPRWIEGTTTSPRWTFCWVRWVRHHPGPPTIMWSCHPNAS